MIPWPVRSFFLTILLTLISFSTGRDTLTPTQPLADNETLLSSSGNFALGFFTPINSKSNNRYLGLWYKKIADQTIVWVANRNSPVVGSKGTLWITANGILTITNQNSTIFWSTNITGITDAVAQLLDTGNLVVKQSSDSGDRYAWQSFDYPTDTMIPGMKLGVDHTTGLIRNLTSWTSYNDPSPGAYNLVMDINGVPEMSLCHGSTKVWRSGPLIGLQFRTGIQFSEMQDVISKYGLTFSFVDNDEEQALFYNISNLSIFSRLVVNFTGYVQQSLWLEGSGQWLFPWTTPKGQCDQIGACGPYGVCDPAASPICCCLQGFMPNNQPGWFLRDGSEGCIRKVTLDCWNGTDGFATVSRVKLPDTSNHTVYMSLSLNECRAMCLNNCSCTAYASANVSGGRLGCLIWATELYDIKLYDEAGQDLYVRLAAADLVSTPGNSPELTPGEISHKGRSALVAIIVSLLVGVLLLACAGCFLWKRRKMRRHKVTGARNHAKDRPTDEVNGNDIELPLFDFAIIEVATDNFSDGGKLGEGGFGPVYKGKLGNDQEIAVKRLSKTSQQGVDEFKNEVVLIAKLQHRNLVRLLGCCIQREERMLIYEYLPNKSLDSFLFGKAKFALDWKTRYQIIIGITRGLLYLHHDSRFRVIHRDLKASNILLDKEMNPKISDFGMARIFGGDETDFNTRKVVGTYGYMSPEYAMEGTFSMKSDVFSFGVLVLEIISGKKNRGEYSFSPHLNLVAHAWSLWNEEKSLQLVDESIIQSFPMNEVLKCIKISLLCVQEHPEDRPLMSSVIQMLGSDIASLPQPKQPGFIARIFPVQTNSSPSKQGLCTVNDITVSILEGR